MTKRLKFAVLGADLVWLVVACVLGRFLRLHLVTQSQIDSRPPHFYTLSLGVALAVWIVLYFTKHLHGFSRGWHFSTICSQIIIATMYLMGSLLALGFVAKFEYSRLGLSLFAVSFPAGVLVIRGVAWWIVKSWSRFGVNRRVVIVGGGNVSKELARKIAKHPELMIEVVGFLYPSDLGLSSNSSKSKTGMSSVRTLNAFELLQEKKVQELILAEQLPSAPEIQKLITSCYRAGMQIHLVPQFYELYLTKARLTEVDDVPLISVEAKSLPVGAPQLKRLMDLTVSAFLLALMFPMMGFITLMLKRRQASAFKKEIRCGLDGAEFSMYRFNVDRWADNLGGFEKFLAQFSLTELPQLWNVMRGEMALIGPRPESLDRVKHYSAWQKLRLSAKPGLTGLAQVYGLRENHSSEEKTHFDLEYIYHWSFFYDLSIFLQTIWILIFRLVERKAAAVGASAMQVNSSIGIREPMHVNSSQSGSN